MPTYSDLRGEIHATVPNFETRRFEHVDDPVVCGQAESELWELIKEAHMGVFGAIDQDLSLLDMDRVLQFIADKQWNAEPFLVARKKDIPKVADLFKEYDETYIQDAHGLYSAKLRLSVVERSDAHELMYGRDFTERIIIHEVAHSASDNDWVDVISGSKNIRKNAYMPWIGLRKAERRIRTDGKGYGYQVEGELFSEADAEEQSAQYADLVRGGRQITPLGGAAVATFDGGAPVWIPERFLYMREEPLRSGERPYKYTVPTFAAVALHNLGQVDEEIPKLMEDSRTEPDAIPELFTHIDALASTIEGGLSTHLNNLDYEQDHFVSALRASCTIADRWGIPVVPEESGLTEGTGQITYK